MDSTSMPSSQMGVEDLEDPDSVPLYPGANVTIGAFLFLLALFTNKYNLVGDAIEQLLSIIALALPDQHVLCTSLHEFKKYFRNLKNPLIHQHYCRNCFGLVEDKSSDKCRSNHVVNLLTLKHQVTFKKSRWQTKLKIYSSKRDFTIAYNIDSREINAWIVLRTYMMEVYIAVILITMAY